MRKVLIITYYWPPAGGPGVQRWVNFVKYLPDYGFQPIIYTPSNPTYPIVDHDINKEIPEGVRVIKRPIMEPYRIASLFSNKKSKQISSGIIPAKDISGMEKALLWIRGNVFIPDARKFWVKPSTRYLLDLVEKEKISTVITTGPPHSMHLIGLQLKQRTDIKWIADFRDPWTSISYHKKLRLTEKSKQKHVALEKKVLQSCDKIIVTSKTTRKEFESISKKPITVITNGYEHIDVPVPKKDLDKKFSISHIGSMLTERNPKNLWKVLSELTKENPQFKKLLEIQLVGVVGEAIIDSLKKYELIENTTIKGYVSHEEAIAFQKKSQLLLLVEINSEETMGIIPGKLFEYLASRRPILAIGPQKWEVGEIIKNTQAGVFYHYDDRKQVKQQIVDWFNAYLTEGIQADSSNIEKYSRKSLTFKLAQELEWE